MSERGDFESLRELMTTFDEQAGNPKIGDFDEPSRIDEDIRERDVAVDDFAAVEVVQPGENLTRDIREGTLVDDGCRGNKLRKLIFTAYGSHGGATFSYFYHFSTFFLKICVTPLHTTMGDNGVYDSH